jgi:hypothetical protein
MGGLFLDNFLAWISASLARMQHAKSRGNGEIRFPLPVVVLWGWVLTIPLAIWLDTAFMVWGYLWTGVFFGLFTLGWLVLSLRYLPAEIIFDRHLHNAETLDAS